MILVGSSLQDCPTWHQNRIQNRSKINPKGHRNQDAIWVGIWSPLGTIFGRFWRQVGPKLAPKSGKLGSQDDVKKMTKNVERGVMQQKWAEGGGSLLVPFGSCFPSFPVPRGPVSLIPRRPVSPIQEPVWRIGTLHFVPQGHGGGYRFLCIDSFI